MGTQTILSHDSMMGRSFSRWDDSCLPAAKYLPLAPQRHHSCWWQWRIVGRMVQLGCTRVQGVRSIQWWSNSVIASHCFLQSGRYIICVTHTGDGDFWVAQSRFSKIHVHVHTATCSPCKLERGFCELLWICLCSLMCEAGCTNFSAWLIYLPISWCCTGWTESDHAVKLVESQHYFKVLSYSLVSS